MGSWLLTMKHKRTLAIDWFEMLHLRPGQRECRLYCLEPGETLFLRLTATAALEVSVVDWEGYVEWSANRADDMPIGGYFTNDTRPITCHVRPIEPPLHQGVGRPEFFRT